MAQEKLPPGIHFAKETHELMVDCAEEFIHLLTFQANEICNRTSKTGYIALQHVTQACEELGFEEYIREIKDVSVKYDRQLKIMQKVDVLGGRG